MPMRTIERMLDDLYRTRERLSKEEIFKRAEAEPIPPDWMYYFRHLPEGMYTRKELVETINRMIKERGREQALGLIPR